MLLPSPTFRPISVSLLKYRSIDLCYLRYRRPSILGDRRRESLYSDCAARMLNQGTTCLQQLSLHENERHRFTAFFNNDAVSCSSVIDHACTRSVCDSAPQHQAERVYVIGDGSNIGLNSATGKVEARGGRLGVLNDGTAAGLMLHANIAVGATSGKMIGLCDAIFHSRSPKTETTPEQWMRKDKQLQRCDKQSSAWELGAYNARELLQAKGYNHRIYVHDAGSDDKIVFSRLLELKTINERTDGHQQREQQDDFVIRMRNFQRLTYQGYRRQDAPQLADIPWFDTGLTRPSKGKQVEKQKLKTVVDKHGSVLGKAMIKIRELNHISKKFKVRRRKGRKAKLRVKAIAIRCCDLNGRWHNLTIVQAWENPRSLPKSERHSAVHWVLLTTLPVESFQEALEVIGIYQRRWIVEQLFRVLKVDGLDIGKTQLGDSEAIIKLIVMALEVAITVLQLVEAREKHEGNPIGEVFSDQMIQLLRKVNTRYEGRTQKQKNPYPSEQLSYATWVIARMGGWKGYGHKPPGPKTIARGLTDFLKFAELTFHINDPDNTLPLLP